MRLFKPYGFVCCMTNTIKSFSQAPIICGLCTTRTFPIAEASNCGVGLSILLSTPIHYVHMTLKRIFTPGTPSTSTWYSKSPLCMVHVWRSTYRSCHRNLIDALRKSPITFVIYRYGLQNFLFGGRCGNAVDQWVWKWENTPNKRL